MKLVSFILELPQCSLLVQLVRAVFNVDLKFLRGVLEKDVTNLTDADALLPSPLQIGEQRLGALSHGQNVREESVPFQTCEQWRLTVRRKFAGEFPTLDEMGR